MRRPLLVVAALAIIVAIFAIRLAPAMLADAQLARIAGGNLRLADTSGTLWDARAVLVAGTARIPVAWQIDPRPLLRGELQLRLVPPGNAGPGSPRGDIRIRGEHVTVTNAQGIVPAAMVIDSAGLTAGWGVGGDLDVSSEAFEWAPPAIRGDLRIRWVAAKLTAPGSAAPLDFGDVSASLSASGDRLAGPIENTGGELALRGEIAVRAATGIELSLVLTPRRADNLALTQALAALGAPDGNGWRVTARYPFR